MNTIKTSEEFVNEKEYKLLLEEIEKGDFRRFEYLSEPKQNKIMRTWNRQQWIKVCKILFQMKNVLVQF